MILSLLVNNSYFVLSITANAQSPEENSQIMELPINASTPEDAVSMFFISFSFGHIIETAQLVEESNKNSPALKSFGKELLTSFDHFIPLAIDINISIDLQNPDLAVAKFIVILHDNMGHWIKQKDSINLRKHTSEDGDYWLIIPGNPQYFQNRMWDFDQHNKKSEFTLRLATELAYPEQMQAQYHLNQSVNQLKQILVGLVMCMSDNDGRLDFDTNQYKESLLVYIKSEAPFTAPGDPNRTMSYSMNPSIQGININDVKDLHTIVAVYLGHDQKLNFKYDGYATVAFLDGSVRKVSREEAKMLRWKP